MTDTVPPPSDPEFTLTRKGREKIAAASGVSVDDLLTLADAASSLGVTPDTLRQSIARGALSGRKIGPRLWVVTRSEVERYRAENLGKRGPKPKAKPG